MVQQHAFATSSKLCRPRKDMASPLILEPPVNRGMTFENFDENAFKLDINVLAAKVPASRVGILKKELGRYASSIRII